MRDEDADTDGSDENEGTNVRDEDDELTEALHDLETGREHETFETLADEAAFTEASDEFREEAIWQRLTERSDEIDPADVGEAVVEKDSFCQQCEYFSNPPSVSCAHPDSQIVELVDPDHFRVRNCPVVARRREIGEFE